MNGKKYVSKYKNPILKFLDEMNTAMFFILVFVGLFVIIGALVFLSSYDDNNNYTEDKWCRTYTNAYRKCHYSYWEKRCVCK